MSIYDVDYKLAGREILPTHKRTTITEVVDSVIEPLNDMNLLFKWFREGSNAPQYNNASTYTFGSVVKYSRRVYLRNEVTDGYVAGTIPTNTIYFSRILDNFIGLSERVMYRSDKLSMEYALNRAFSTTFNNPPTLSDIYITNVNTSDVNFGVGEIDEATSTVPQSDILSEFFVSENDFVAGETDFIIYVPIAVYTALGSTNTERDSQIQSVVNKIKLAGYIYQIQTY